jgi:WD40 repeat protein/tRNA A-37 threonylcarbamoyl transferase component Bud32
MATENFKEAGEIFQNAIEIEDLAKREQYIENACKEDPKLRMEVEALLGAHEKAGDYLEAPAVGSNVTTDESAQIEGPGTKIGRYELLSLIGEGGMGLVYLAEQKEPVKRRVALKIIKPGMDSRQVIARFEAERQTLALLDHPNIAHVFDAGTTETGRPYFVMEYVKGMSITRYCDENRLDVEQRLRLFREVCEGVHYAHQKGIIHRDLKPSNILVSIHGDRAVPKIIDFGIAKAATGTLTEKTMFTFQGQLLGTPEYMSPEQVDLATQDIDTRSDIYSLGVVLYELLAGILPFERESLEKIGFSELQRTLREQEPASPSVRLSNLGEKAKAIADSRMTQVVPLARRLHRELEWIPLKAMRKDRCRRYKSASDMADDIQSYLNGNPLLAGPETAMYRVQKFVHKHAGSVATAALVSVAVILGLVVSVIFGCRAEQARQQEATARKQVEQALIRAEKAEKATKEKAEELRSTLYVNNVQLADARYREGNARQVRSLLDSCPEDLRGWEWNRLNYIHDESLMTLRGHEGQVNCAIFSPNGRRIITCGDDKTIKLWDLTTGQQLMTFRGHSSSIYALAVSPDGKHIASGSNEGIIKLWDVETGAEVITLGGHRYPILALAFSPDGKQVASGSDSYDRNIVLWDAQTGTQLTTLRGHREVNALAYSPDGKRLASGSGDWTIKLWDVQTGTEVTTLRGHGNWVRAVGFSPDGKRIVSGSWDKTIKVWDAETWRTLTTIHGHDGPVLSVAFSPDGKTIASGGYDNTIRVWDADSGDELKTFHGHNSSVNSISFSPDGINLISASSDGAVKLWDMMIDRESCNFHGYSEYMPRCVAFSPNGKLIAADGRPSYYGGTITLWDAQTGEQIRTILGHRYYPLSVAFSPDGKRIISGEREHRVARVWDALTGAQLMALHGHKGAVTCAVFSPDGKYIITGSYDKTIKLWDAASGSEVMTFKGHTDYILSVAFSPDGKRIVSASRDRTVKIWDAEMGGELMNLVHTDSVYSAAFSPDGVRIVTGCRDGRARLWDGATGAELMTLLGHRGIVFSVAFSPDGKRIVTAGGIDGTAKLWDTTTGAELLTLDAYAPVGGVAFSSDGKSIAAAIYGKNLVLWDSAAPSGGYEPRRKAEIARRLVEKLLSKCGLYRDVISELQSDTKIDPDIRRMASNIANSHKWEDASDGLEYTPWATVSLPDKDVKVYKTALEKAGKANAIEPNNPAILNTLAAAQYRVGSYEDALKTLAKSEQILSGAGEEPDPWNLAFKAMVLHKISRSEEAKAALRQLRKMCQQEHIKRDMDVQGLLAEAEKLIAGVKQ